MFKYKMFLVSDSDNFDPDVYPKVKEELYSLVSGSRSLSSKNKTETLLSFVQGGAKDTQWNDLNNEFLEYLNADKSKTFRLVNLFESGNHNHAFIGQLKDYVKETIEQTPTDTIDISKFFKY